MRLTSLISLALQICAFVALTIALFVIVGEVSKAGGSFFEPRFAATQVPRLLALLAPYMALPVAIALTILLRRRGKYLPALWMPLTVIALVGVIGQVYLRMIPDPIMENLGPRVAPYAGFLILPPEAVPEGFKEERHRYTKIQYSVLFSKIVDGEKTHLGINEGDNIIFDYSGSELVQEFEHEGVKGEVYTHHYKDTGGTLMGLVWLNPPKQRINIYVSPKGDYTPDDLIQILKSMKPADEQVPAVRMRHVIQSGAQSTGRAFIALRALRRRERSA